ncbi:MAG TPA: hypothetical protein VGF89_06785 [Steroidobacteraceae bacterium]
MVQYAIRTLGIAWLLTLALAPAHAPAAATAAQHYRNFRVAIYVVVNSTRSLADPATREREYQRISSQLHFDKIYLEVYRSHQFASDAQIEAVKAYFLSKGIQVSGGVTLAAGGADGQFGTFDYELPQDRAECQKAVELAARHFDEVILDDFFFFNTKSDTDIAAKGARSWTQYRLDTMRSAAQDLVVGPAHAINPRIRVIVKYPNWYEHFQGLGYDLEQEAQQFDAIYTGTETRDPFITDQLLQQYQSYEIYRYLSSIRPRANLGGWVDTYDVRYADRYAEQLWDTLLAKSPEITLFNWYDLSRPEAAPPGERPWSAQPTDLNWQQLIAGYRAGALDAGAGWARIAGYALERIDTVLGGLGKPIGLASYKPFQSSGEDYLHNYLGDIGIPIELRASFPTDASVVLLTECAKFDPQIVDEIRSALSAGRTVVITSGLLAALQSRGIQDIAEIAPTGRVAAIHDFINGYGAGSGERLNDADQDNPAVLFPELQFLTNDSWPIIRGVAGSKGFPLLLMNRYSRGVLLVLTVPENLADLYQLPRALLGQLRSYLMRDFPVRVDAPAYVSIFAYDNNAFVLESFRPDTATIIVSTVGAGTKLRDLGSGVMVQALADSDLSATGNVTARRSCREASCRSFRVTLAAHSLRAYQVEK